MNQLDSYDFTTLKNLETLMLSTFLGEDALREEYVRRLWTPICNASVESINKLERDRVITRCTSTNRFLASYEEKG